MTAVLLGMPLLLTAFFIVILLIFTVVVLISIRRQRFNAFRGGERFEDDNSAYAEEVAETYMRLLEGVQYNKTTFKYFDCSICLREFEDGEKLQRIPNCEHVFHEACLRKWFVQARMPSMGWRATTVLGVISSTALFLGSHTARLRIVVRSVARTSFSASSTVAHSSKMRRKRKV